MSETIQNLTGKAKNTGQTHSMELLLLPIAVLIIVGVVANNFQSSGIQTNPTLPTPNCSPYVAICYVQPPLNGCDVNATLNCKLSLASTFSFLSANSPFTTLLQGNVLGFISVAFNTGETSNIVYSAYTTCIALKGNSFANATGSAIHNFMCQGISSVNSTNFKPNAGVPMNATANGGNNSIWTVTGCRINSAFNYPCTINFASDGFASWNGTNAYMTFYGFYVKNGTALGASSTCSIFSTAPQCQIIMPWLYTNGRTTFTCPSTAHVNGLNINATNYYCLFPVTNPATPTTVGASALPQTFAALSFLFGAFLFFLGSGVAITTALVGFSVNEQGTKLAQVMGIGILIWSFIYSEFGNWLSSLPLNLSIVGFTILTTMFFMGLYWRLFEWE